MKFTLFVGCLFLLISCSENQKKRWCKKGIEKAKKEIQKEGLALVRTLTLVEGSNRYDKELKEILKQYEIEFQYVALSCTDLKFDEIHNCYKKTMNAAIENKFGNGFIDKISRQADEVFANRENYVHEDFDLDEKPYFINPKGNEYSGSALNKFLNQHLKYPDEYELAKSVEERPFVRLKFIINREGTPRDFKVFYSFFPDEKEKYRDYFEEEVLHIISQIPRWEPGRIHGKEVETNFTRDISLDWII